MRISSSLYFQTGLNSINRQQSELMHIFQQVGSGNRMVTAADDPLAAAQSITLSQAQSMNKRFAENRAVANGALGQEENILNSLTNELQDVKTRLIYAANGSLSDADRATLADDLRSAKETIMGLANSTDSNGQYLFSGSQGGTPPFDSSMGSTSYQGDYRNRDVQVDQTRLLSSSDNAFDIFARAVSGTSVYITGGEPTNTGTGLISQASVTDRNAGPAPEYTISFSDATTYSISYTDTNGDPQTEAGTLTLVEGKATIALPQGVKVSFEGVPQNGDTFTVEQPNTASGGGNDNMNLFATFDSVIAALEAPINGDPAAQANLRNTLNGAMQRIDLNYNNVLTVRASVGARMNEIDALKSNGALQSLHISGELSRLEDLDFYAASTQLELRKSALEAAALAFKKIQSTSLFSMGSGG